jgi:hypothetical protein
MRRFLMAATVAVGTTVACQTITEEMPSRPTPVSNPVPIVVVPIAIPTPEPAPAPAPNPAPNPVPTNNPAPPPDDEGGDFPDNNAPVAKLGAKVYFLECNGAEIPGSSYATEAQVGCRIHFDCTPKDASNAPTRAKGTPEWSFNNTSLINVGRVVDYTPTVTAKNPGQLVAWAVVDGVRSNDVSIRIVP